MSAPMPTRRAFRPDSQYYRTTRRQGLRRAAASSGGRGAAIAVLVVAGGMLVWWAAHGGLWAAVFGYGGLAVVIAMIALVISARR